MNELAIGSVESTFNVILKNKSNRSINETIYMLLAINWAYNDAVLFAKNVEDAALLAGFAELAQLFAKQLENAN